MQVRALVWLSEKLHSEHQERHDHDGNDDQADEGHGLLPPVTPGVTARCRRLIPGAHSSPDAGNKKPVIFFQNL
jgi:hypothetical protein